MTVLRRLAASDLPRLGHFWQDQWGGDQILVHDQLFRSDEVEGFIADDWAGVLTYVVRNGECEIISLNSMIPQRGVGRALVDAVMDEARQRGCNRVCVTTTNDNLNAMGFYQRRGFHLVRLRPGAVERARKWKPGIPEIGDGGIPLRDEIELEILLPW